MNTGGALLEPEPTSQNLRSVLWPLFRRLPAYVKLAWALVREPAIPARHKSLLYGAAALTVPPLSLVTAPIPVLGQLDGVILLLLGIRQAARHCPPEVLRAHQQKLRLRPGQADKDLHVALYAAWLAAGRVARPAARSVRFAGRVAYTFTRRMVRRLST